MNKIVTIKCGMYNCYVLCSDDQAILVDTCGAKQRKLILERIKDYNIKLIILTHGHVDHIGNAAFFAKHFNAKIAMHKDDVEIIQNNRLRKMEPIGPMGTMVKIFSKGSMKKKVEMFTPDILLEEGDSLDQYGIDAEIVHLEGHTSGSIGIKSGNKSFIVGDALMNFMYPTVSLYNEDFTKLQKSVDKLRESGAEVFYPGHGSKISSSSLFR